MNLSIAPKKNMHTHANENLLEINNLSASFMMGSKTGALYYLDAKNLQYNDSYFLGEYKQQYGQTYIEDEKKLRQVFKSHLKCIQNIKSAPGTLFEIGCATGFFLDEARNAGYNVFACELSKYASEYARKNFQLEVYNKSFLDLPEKKYDIIVACYTLEHFQNQPEVFKKISRMLHTGGLLFFSIPSSSGPTMEFSSNKWQKTHPADHFIDYDAKSIKKVLELYQMKLKVAHPASFHQDRTRGWKSLLPKTCYQIYAKFFCYADTINVFATKI